MMDTFITIKENGDKEYYGAARVGNTYPVVAIGIDWFLIKVNGKPLYIQQDACVVHDYEIE
jgi:hypothetical protein